MKITGVIAFVSMLLFIAAVDSRADELTDLKKSVEEQQRELEELRKKVDELEERRRLEEEAAREMEEIRPKFGVNLGVFGDINFSSDSREKENETSWANSPSTLRPATENGSTSSLSS
jgi:Skp family chaperone for outer membrane proteins